MAAKTKEKSAGAKTSSATSPSIKNPEVYEALREQGASAEKAARISNAQAKYGAKEAKSPSTKGGKAPPYEDWSRADLYDKAKEIGIPGLSRAAKGDLIDALRSH